jgi:hypothetical protein
MCFHLPKRKRPSAEKGHQDGRKERPSEMAVERVEKVKKGGEGREGEERWRG